MKHTLKNLVLVALLSAVIPAQAAIQEYTFSGAFDSGFYSGVSYSGAFSFDDATLTNTGLELLNLNTLSMDLLSTTFAATGSTYGPNAAFQDGVFLGLDWSVDSVTPDVGFTFVAGSLDTSDAFVAYDTNLGLSGTGSVSFTAVTAAVPEPELPLMFAAGFGLISLASRRRYSA